jgi:DNA-directed RNA polymerase specialized sigma24 family protein
VALVAQSARGMLLSAHRHLLRFEDLEDCYSQATFELVAQARRGELRFSDRDHLRNTLELRFVSRVRDRRRALHGRSPAEATFEQASSLGGVGEEEIEVVDLRADVERCTMLRLQLRSLERAARALSTDQRLVLACQIGLQMSAEEFCERFGWSQEKHRKVAQRARSRLRRLLDEPDRLEAVRGQGAGVRGQGAGVRGAGETGQGAEAREAEKSFPEKRPVLDSASE